MSGGDCGEPVFARMPDGNYARFDHGKGVFVPHDPSQEIEIPTDHLEPSASRMQSGRARGGADSRAINYGMQTAHVSTRPASYDEFSADPDVLRVSSSTSAQQSATQRVAGRGLQSDSAPNMQPSDQGDSPHAMLHGGVAPRLMAPRYAEPSRRSQPVSNAGYPYESKNNYGQMVKSGLVHELGVVKDGVMGNRYIPPHSYRFSYKFKIERNVRVDLTEAMDGVPVIKAFDADEILSAVVESITLGNTHRDSVVTDKEVSSALENAVVYSVEVVNAYSNLDQPVGVILKDHPALNPIVDSDDPGRSFMYIKGGKGSETPLLQHDHSALLFSPITNMLIDLAGALDMSRDYVLETNRNSSRCKVRRNSLLWSIGGVYGTHLQRWKNLNLNHNENDEYIQHVPVQIVKDWEKAACAYVHQAIALRRLLPRATGPNRKAPPPLRMEFHVLGAKQAPESSRSRTKKPAYINLTFSVVGCLPIKVPHGEIMAMHEQRARSKGGAQVRNSARPYLFFPDGHGEVLHDMWSKYMGANDTQQSE